MECNKAKQLLSEYIDRVLDEKTEQRLEEHITGCEDCGNELSILKQMIRNVSQVEPAAAPDDFLYQLNKKIHKTSGARRWLNIIAWPFKMRPSFQFATATAMAVLVIFVINIKSPEGPLYEVSRKSMKPDALDMVYSKKKREVVSVSDKEMALEEGLPETQTVPKALAKKAAAPRAEREPEPYTLGQVSPSPEVAGSSPSVSPPVMTAQSDIIEIQQTPPVEWVLKVHPVLQPHHEAAILRQDKKGAERLVQEQEMADEIQDNEAEERIMAYTPLKEETPGASITGYTATRSTEHRGRAAIANGADEMDRWVRIIEASAQKYEGKVVSVEKIPGEPTNEGAVPRLIVLKMPEAHHAAFYRELAALNRFQMPEQGEIGMGKGTDLIRIRLEP